MNDKQIISDAKAQSGAVGSTAISQAESEDSRGTPNLSSVTAEIIPDAKDQSGTVGSTVRSQAEPNVPLGTRWISVVTDIVFPVGIVKSIIWGYAGLQNGSDVGLVVTVLSLVVGCVFGTLIYGLRCRLKWSFGLMMALLLLFPFVAVYVKYLLRVQFYQLARSVQASASCPDSGEYVLLALGFFVVFSLPQLIYFYKRRRLFGVE